MKKSIDDFLTDPDFIRWVKKPSRESTLYWEKWQKANPDKREMLHKARELILSVNYEKPPADKHRYNRILESIIQQSSQIQGEKRKSFISWHQFRWIAASLAIFMSVFLLINTSNEEEQTAKKLNEPVTITKTNPKGIKSTITLPDRSIVHLNSMSTIRYKSDFTNNRQIHLNGEAYFEVKAQVNSSFEVVSGEITTTALGTSFNVEAYPEDNYIKVALEKGKVKIESENNESLLNPGKAFQFNKSTKDINTSEFDNEKAFGWIRGILVLEENDVKSFVNKIERWYGVEVKIQGTPRQEWKINGKFKNMSLELVMQSIAFAKDINFRINGDELILIF